MRTVVRWLGALWCALALGSSLLVLASNLDPAYRARTDDALWFVIPYAALHGWMGWTLVRDTPAVAAVALARAGAACGFLLLAALVPPAAKLWLAWSPSRYVYQLFDWGAGAEIVLFAFLFLGRGIGNLLAAVALLGPRLVTLRLRRPLLGRLVTVVPLAIVVTLGWQFIEIFQVAAARDVAQMVVDEIDCERVRTQLGETTTDVRALGKRRYVVRITYGCPTTRVMAADEQQRVGMVEGATRCCAGAT